ncbi:MULTISPECIES: hypothetical protein [Streptomyces]|uniref:DUF732 domain-containing protein n=1 Tax=Streptomyces solicathayae TaxID=3081768 RepID=A0ABZ0M4R9_9ACTN|nr:hypothetical protein [Streptomyces sp. HUAS YS2]WOX26024.1 hypothetical protein R2D22_33420 [Streptomyces sp. HUAS YS2]
MSRTRFASEHRWVYIGAIVILLAMVVIGLIQFRSVKQNNDTYAKAQELSKELVAAGYPAPDIDVVEQLLGTDGGAVCEDPGSTLKRALWNVQQLSNGATGPGQRPVIGDTRAVELERIVLQVYCPDKVDEFDEDIDDLDTRETVKR